MTLNTTPDQTPDESFDELVRMLEELRGESPVHGQPKHPVRTQGAPLIRLSEFLGDVSLHVYSVMLGNFDSAVISGKIDAVTLTGADISLNIESVSGEAKTITRRDELVRNNERAQSWRNEMVKQATKARMLHTGQIEAGFSELTGNSAHFDELLTLRREFARQQEQVKPKTTTQAKTRPKRTKKRATPAQ
jgi:hypothetical protein